MGTNKKSRVSSIWKDMILHVLGRASTLHLLDSFNNFNHPSFLGLMRRVLSMLSEVMAASPWSHWREEVLPIGALDLERIPFQQQYLGWNQRVTSLHFWEQLRVGDNRLNWEDVRERYTLMDDMRMPFLLLWMRAGG